MARIIVIDDDGLIRAAVRRALESEGHEVLDADDGKRGLALCAERQPDLLLTDIFMPGEDGIVTLIGARKAYPGLKVIVMSGGGFDGRLDLLDDAKGLGAAAILRKPFGPDEVRRVVRAVLEGSTD